MVKIRSTNDLILSQLDFFRKAQPRLDIKPGSVARDLVIDGPSTQVARVYEELSNISNLQSIRFLNGSDLEKYAQNFGLVKQRGSKATGPALLTFSSLEADIPLNSGDLITARNGASFEIINSFTISPVFESTFRATATRFRSDLDFVGITDEYAVEVLVRATSPGISGNISKYSLNRASIASINNVVNVFPFSGGRDVENDSSFKNRIIGTFSGANVGTAIGYRSKVINSDPSVIDAVVVEPGDTLMIRDGTQVFIDEEGNRTIISDGTGGKVDIYILGTRIQEITDTYIFRDLSNIGNITSLDNDKVLGQISEDAGKTVARRRLDNLSNNVLPTQPIRNIIQVSGSSSGSNFIEKQVDSLGRVTGNYELVKDEGAFGGSPWGFDRLRWISDRITDYEENKTKGIFNGQDSLSFTDVLSINSVRQSISVTNENSRVLSSDRSIIQLGHLQVSSVTRVFNVTTGERYVVVNQNPNGGSINSTGKIKIGGQSLPAVSDTLQVDYTWLKDFNPYFDFDNKYSSDNPREVRDSIDWGYSNVVNRERAILTSSGSFLTASATHPISSVISVNIFQEEESTIDLSSGRLIVVVSESIDNVISVIRNSDGFNIWNTKESDGAFSGQTVFLPTDTLGEFGEAVTVVFNTTDVFNADEQGNFNSSTITIIPSSDAVAGELVEITYIADVSVILPTITLSDLPAIRSGNQFSTNTLTNIGTQPTTHIFNSDVINTNLRLAPSPLGLNIVGSVSPGTITVSGTTLTRYADVVFTATNNGLQQNMAAAIKSVLNLSSNQAVSSDIKIAKIAKLEKVTTTSSLEVLSSDFEYDLIGCQILDNNFDKKLSALDTSLSNTEFQLSSASENENNSISVGDRLRVTFYLSNYSDSENVNFGRSGILYTDKTFAIIDTISISSGFISNSSSSATLTITNLNQPTTRSRYTVFYDYKAPKVNERINIRYNYDKLITDATLNIEEIRPIGADVLAKRSIAILVDITVKIVVTSAYVNNSEIVRQNVRDAISSGLTPNSLSTIIDGSDLIDAAYSVDGVDRARITYFNRTGETGSVLSIESQKNEYIQANNVIVEVETR